MKCFVHHSYPAFVAAFLFFGTLSHQPARAQKDPAPTESTTQPSKASASKPKTEVYENMQDHFDDGDKGIGFPMSMFPEGTTGGLMLAALGAGALGGLLAVGGGSIAVVNYQSQSSPEVSPGDRLAARGAGRVGLGVFGLGALLMFSPPVLMDWALPTGASQAPAPPALEKPPAPTLEEISNPKESKPLEKKDKPAKKAPATSPAKAEKAKKPPK